MYALNYLAVYMISYSLVSTKHNLLLKVSPTGDSLKYDGFVLRIPTITYDANDEDRVLMSCLQVKQIIINMIRNVKK